jgi:TPR repeat protein
VREPARVFEGDVAMRELRTRMAPRARLSAGEAFEPGAWRVAAVDLAQAALEPPPGFVGVMEIAVELRSADNAVADKSTMRIEWTSPLRAAPDQTQLPAPDPGSRASAAPPRPGDVTIDSEEIAALVKRGRDFIANGDLASARLVLRRAADGGDAQAALLLGSTYDPAMFKQLRVIGSAPDPAQARVWYQRAAELGSAEAVDRLEGLAEGAS